jgi:putative ABC transport system permease protein
VTDGSRRARLAGTVELGVRRVLGTLRSGSSSRITLSVVGVAIAVAMMTTVAGVSLGLASQSAVQGSDVDYWVVPAGADLDTIAVSVDGPRLGNVHEISATLAADDRVDYATPVLIQLVPVQPTPAGADAVPNATNADSSREYLVLVGVIGPTAPTDSGTDTTDRPRTVAGVPVDPLRPGDPHYANGSYDGEWTGETVLSGAAADLLAAGEGDRLQLAGTAAATNRSFTVTHVANGSLQTGVGPAPVAVVHLSELQAATGATADDPADQLLVSTDSRAVRDRIERLYPGTDVVTRAGLSTSGQQVSASSLPFAMGVAGFVVATVVGALFVATLFGLEVLADRRRLGVLTAVGVSDRSTSIVVFVQVVALCLLGGVVGSIAGAVGIVLVNAVAGHLLGVGDVALFRPLLLAYGLGVAALIGLLAAPYPLVLSRRTDLSEVL